MWFQLVGDIKGIRIIAAGREFVSGIAFARFMAPAGGENSPGMRLFGFMMARSTPLNYPGTRRMESENANSN